MFVIGYYGDYYLKLNRCFYLDVRIRLNELIKIQESLLKYFNEFIIFIILNYLFNSKLLLRFLKDCHQVNIEFCLFSCYFLAEKNLYISQNIFLNLKIF